MADILSEGAKLEQGKSFGTARSFDEAQGLFEFSQRSILCHSAILLAAVPPERHWQLSHAIFLSHIQAKPIIANLKRLVTRCD
jgi:hypothetical protein